MENKSKCCQCSVEFIKDENGKGYMCKTCKDWPCELQKNSGLTLSEIAADEHVLEFERPKITDKLYRNKMDGYPFSIESLAATDWVVTKRKSDEAVKVENREWFKLFDPRKESGSVMIGCKSYQESITEFERLQNENAELKESYTAINLRYDDVAKKYSILVSKIRELL